nr:MAG TPA: hypothetical protein [Caudoviricetes sp.]
MTGPRRRATRSTAATTPWATAASSPAAEWPLGTYSLQRLQWTWTATQCCAKRH